jgi:hypothetical protein
MHYGTAPDSVRGAVDFIRLGRSVAVGATSDGGLTAPVNLRASVTPAAEAQPHASTAG